MSNIEWNILNGDVLYDQLKSFTTEGVVIMRECLIEGPVNHTDLDSFIQIRRTFFQEEYNIDAESYNSKAESQLKQLAEIKTDHEITMWFEFDLFCQTNMWFICHYLAENIITENIYWAMPNHSEWTGFGFMSEEDLRYASDNKVRLTKDQILDFSNCWEAYQANDLQRMRLIGKNLSLIFPVFNEVIEAHIQRFPSGNELPRPLQSLKDIISELNTSEFKSIFEEFCKRDGIYGFGDLQIRNMLKKMGINLV